MTLAEAVLKKVSVLKHAGQEKDFNIVLEHEGIEVEVDIALFDPELGFKVRQASASKIDRVGNFNEQFAYICSYEKGYLPREIEIIEKSEQYKRAVLKTKPIKMDDKTRYSQFLLDSGTSIVFSNVKCDKEDKTQLSSIVMSRRAFNKMIENLTGAMQQ